MSAEPQSPEILQKQLLRELFVSPESQAYAILDGASNPSLLDHLYADVRPAFECLYRGELEPDMAECAPYLVLLQPDTPFTQWVTGEGWGLHWGIFARANCDLRAMRYHLRKLNMVYEPETNKPLLFRYYDPRVLNIFLPTCDAQQVQSFFGPVQAWFAEAQGATHITRFCRDEQQQVVVDQIL